MSCSYCVGAVPDPVLTGVCVIVVITLGIVCPWYLFCSGSCSWCCSCPWRCSFAWCVVRRGLVVGLVPGLASLLVLVWFEVFSEVLCLVLSL